MTDPRDEHLLPVHDVALALFHRDGLELRRVGAGGGLGHRHRLHAQLAARDLGEIGPLLVRRSVPQHASHDIHLAVHRAGKGARAADLLENDRRLGDRQPRAAVLLRNECREPAGLGQRLHERVGISAFLVDLAPVFAAEAPAQLADRVAQLAVIVLSGNGLH